MTENQIQGQIIAYLKAVLTDQHDVTAIPNGCIRTEGGRAGNAVPGLLKGVPDLLIFGQGCGYFMEVKSATGKLSPHQREFSMWCSAGGNMPWALVRSVEDVRTCLSVWGIPTRQHRII